MDHFEKLVKTTQYTNYLSKVWIYRGKCLVLDFEYKSIRFAFDIEFDESSKFHVSMVDRNSHLNYFLNKSSASKFKIFKNLTLESLDLKLLTSLNSVFNTIDNEYKYKVSVIVPVYNREKLILKCIDSLNNQTLDKDLFEVIFVDDCSTDNTVDVIKKKCYPLLNYTILERPVGSGNASAPRNDGLKKAKGKYVFYLDSDDYISLDCLEEAFKFSEKNVSDVTYLKIGSDEEFPRNTPIRSFKNGNVNKAEIAKHHLMRSNGSCKYFNRVFLLIHKFIFDQSLPVREDKLFNMQVMSRTDKVSILANKAYVMITSHDGEHLVKSKLDIYQEPLLYLNGFNWVYTSNLNFNHCNQLYNAWLVIIIERLISVLKNKNYEIWQRELFFNNVLITLGIKGYSLEEDQIYNTLKPYLTAINEKNFELFIKKLESDGE